MTSYRTGFASLKAPAKYRPLQRQVDVMLAKGESFAVAMRSGSLAKMDTAYAAMTVASTGARAQVRGRRRHDLRLEPPQLAA